jgi:sirohydrochlorin ferrochelatase
MTTLAQLQAMGASPSQKFEKKTITWDRAHLGEDTVDVDFFVRRQTAGDLEAVMSAPAGERLAVRISRMARFGDGGEVLTQEQATGLDPLIAMAMSRAIDEVNSVEKKASQKTT